MSCPDEGRLAIAFRRRLGRNRIVAFEIDVGCGGRTIRPLSVLGLLPGFLHERFDLVLDGFEFVFARDALFNQASSQSQDRAAFFPLGNILARAVGVVAHPFGMSPRAIGFAFDKSRTAAGPGPFDGFTSNLVNRDDVVAVNLLAGSPVVRGPPSDVGNAARIVESDFGRELVVLADEQHGQVPDAGHVQAFVERPVVDGSVAEERNRDIVLLQNPKAVPTTACLQDARPDDAAGSHHPDLGREQMHAAAATLRHSGLSSEQFGNQGFRFQPLAQRVSVPAMRAEDNVVIAQMSTHTRRDGFLANVGMAGSKNEPARVIAGELLFRLANDLHPAIQSESRGLVESS